LRNQKGTLDTPFIWLRSLTAIQTISRAQNEDGNFLLLTLIQFNSDFQSFLGSEKTAIAPDLYPPIPKLHQNFIKSSIKVIAQFFQAFGNLYDLLR